MPFDASDIHASSNLAADISANVAADSSGRVLAVRLSNTTDDPGMKDMRSFLIARDTMHQQQWLAAIEDMGGAVENLPIPNAFAQSQEAGEYSDASFGHMIDGTIPEGHWSAGLSMDGRGEFSVMKSEPMGGKPSLAPARPDGGAQAAQSSKSGATGLLGQVEGAIGRNL